MKFDRLNLLYGKTEFMGKLNTNVLRSLFKYDGCFDKVTFVWVKIDLSIEFQGTEFKGTDISVAWFMSI